MTVVISSLLLLGAVGLCGAVLLYVVSRRFRVVEDPRVAEIEQCLPGANCGACGRRGCHDFAVTACAKSSLDDLTCPGAGADAMERIAAILGVMVSAHQRQVAVLHCNGTCEARPRAYLYDGVESCAVMAAVAVGTAGCAYGCLGCGDCVAACPFDAIHMDSDTGLPAVDVDKCTGCGRCVAECPRTLLELRPLTQPRVWVACNNRQKGAVARKVCTAACIGCGKCFRTCTHGAINLSSNLAYIDPQTCTACGDCIPQCPTGAILTAK